MGKRGPQPMPTPLKVLHGETRPERLNPDAPKPRGAGPVQPEDMDERAKEVWARVTEAMALTGILTPVDSDSLRAYCEAVSRYEHAARMLAESGPLVRGARQGELVKNPLHQVVRDNAALIRLFARELGFVPAAREGIKVGGAGEAADPFTSWEMSG